MSPSHRLCDGEAAVLSLGIMGQGPGPVALLSQLALGGAGSGSCLLSGTTTLTLFAISSNKRRPISSRIFSLGRRVRAGRQP